MENHGEAKDRRRNKPRTRVERQMDNLKDMTVSEREQILDKLIDDKVDEESEAKAKAALVDPLDFADEAMDRMENWGKRVGLSTGYYDIDKMTVGLAKGELTIVAGETSQGKTLLCCNIAANLIRQKHKVVFVTLEMTKAELLSRLWKILGYGTDGEGCEEMAKACEYLRFQQIDRMDWKTIPYLIEQAKQWGAECVFIDHLHYFAREMHDVANELGIITQEFKQAAIKYEIPIVLVSHTRKVAESKRRADLNDLRGSSYIAQDSDIVLMVSQLPDEFPDSICISLDKNRNRQDLRIGAEVWHKKNGLVIMDIPILDRASVDAYSVISPSPVKPESPPPQNQPAPWEVVYVDEHRNDEKPLEEKPKMNGAIW